MSFSSGSELSIDNFSQFGVNVGMTTYAGTLLDNFGAGESIDLKDFAATGAASSFDATSGLLQLTNGTGEAATLSFQTASLGSGLFHVASDGEAGVLVTHS
jgi:hypothetical protein